MVGIVIAVVIIVLLLFLLVVGCCGCSCCCCGCGCGCVVGGGVHLLFLHCVLTGPLHKSFGSFGFAVTSH